MKLKLLFTTKNPSFTLPVNINSYIYSIIENIKNTSPQFSQNNDNHNTSLWKNFKEFTFSQLHIPNRKIINNRIIGSKCNMSLYISSPDEHFISCLMHSFLDLNEIRIADCYFDVSQAELIPHKTVGSKARFTCLSPFVVTRPSETKYLQFALPNDYNLGQYISDIMLKRYQKYSSDSMDSHIDISFEPSYVLKRQGKITKLISVNFPDKPYPIKVKSMLAPIVLSGNPKILQYCLESGLGFYTEFGFGMIDAIN